MATANNTIKTRIQLKSDTEANWDKAGPKENSAGFVPLLGELIIYSADGTHPFSRLKIGDGVTNVVNLPFADSGNFINSTVSRVVNWSAGTKTTATIENNTLNITDGLLPILNYYDTSARTTTQG